MTKTTSSAKTDACVPDALMSAIRVSNPKAGSVARYACRGSYALAHIVSDCEGCVPELLYLLENIEGEWHVRGGSHNINPGLCEESRVMPYDDCGLFFDELTPPT